jgi:superfamily I DNA/RNA helicase
MYRSRLLENNIVDFDDLLLLTLAIFDNHQNVAEK